MEKTTTSKYIKPYNIDKRLEKFKQEFDNNCIVDLSLCKLIYIGNVDVKILYFIEKYYNNYLIIVNGDVNLQDCNLTELPVQLQIVKGDFNIQDNSITTFKNFPLYVKGSLRCNIKDFNIEPTKESLKDICIVKGRIIDKGMDPPSGLLMYLDVVQKENK